MKVIFVANSAWYLSNFRASTLERLTRAHSVTCIFPDGERDNSLDGLNCKLRTFPMLPSGKNILNELRSLYALYRAIKTEGPCIVYSFNPKTNLYSLISCWLLNTPCVPNVSGVGAASQLKGVLGIIYKACSKFFYRRAAYVYFQNCDDYRSFLDQNIIVPNRSEIIPGSGVNLARFSPSYRNAKTVRFLMASRLIKQKGVIEYLEAAKLMIDNGYEVEFLLAGVKDYSERAVKENLISSYTSCDRIKFLGHVTDMSLLLSEVDCVILPSYYPEGVPRSLLEAASAGKIIITTDTVGCRETVDHGHNGFLIPPQSTLELYKAIVEVVNMPLHERLRMQKSSRYLAENRFNEEYVIESYVKTTNSFLSQSKN